MVAGTIVPIRHHRGEAGVQTAAICRADSAVGCRREQWMGEANPLALVDREQSSAATFVDCGPDWDVDHELEQARWLRTAHGQDVDQGPQPRPDPSYAPVQRLAQ
jgi:hypothetical protein